MEYAGQVAQSPACCTIVPVFPTCATESIMVSQEVPGNYTLSPMVTCIPRMIQGSFCLQSGLLQTPFLPPPAAGRKDEARTPRAPAKGCRPLHSHQRASSSRSCNSPVSPVQPRRLLTHAKLKQDIAILPYGMRPYLTGQDGDVTVSFKSALLTSVLYFA